MKNNTVAICYDFDGTLAPGNMQERDFIPNKLKIKVKDFWEEVKQNARKHNMDEILSYLEITLKQAKAKNVRFDKNAFRAYGRKIVFFDGVAGWFKRINQYGKEKKLQIEHYIISSGLKPMIEGTTIAQNFKYIFACDFKYDVHEIPVFPSVAINYTTKTQYLFRINKSNQANDLLNNWNNDVNKFTADQDRPIPFSQMIYLGDGETDVPAMKMLKFQGGYSIGIYTEDKKKLCESLLQNKRCSFIAPADYTKGGETAALVKKILDKIQSEIALKK